MAHEQQLKFLEILSNEFSFNKSNKNLKVIEIGSYIVNQSIRKYFKGASEYIGVDLIPGPGVDYVGSGNKAPFPDEYFTVSVSCECFEHNPDWIATMNNMYRMTKKGGIVIISCASRGRIEHGTIRTNGPQFSPGTQFLGLNYYKNLNKKDFVENFNLKKMFSDHLFLYNSYSHDLYFIGTVIGSENIFHLNKELIRRKLLQINKIINAKKPMSLIICRHLFYAPLFFVSFLPDHLYQKIATRYSKFFLKFRSIFF
jgi:SAM-dependent methyltransferase